MGTRDLLLYLACAEGAESLVFSDERTGLIDAKQR